MWESARERVHVKRGKLIGCSFTCTIVTANYNQSGLYRSWRIHSHMHAVRCTLSRALLHMHTPTVCGAAGSRRQTPGPRQMRLPEKPWSSGHEVTRSTCWGPLTIFQKVFVCVWASVTVLENVSVWVTPWVINREFVVMGGCVDQCVCETMCISLQFKCICTRNT